MIISERISSLSASPIRKLNPYAAAAKAAGKKVYHLNIGQPDIETPAGFLDAIRRFDKKIIAYGDSHGNPRLLEAIRAYYQSWNMDYDIGQITITNGGSEALLIAMMALCDPGDEILVFEPFYANYNALPERSISPFAPLRRMPKTAMRCQTKRTWNEALRRAPKPYC